VVNKLEPIVLNVKKLHENATLPTVGYAGSDLCYDLYALEDTNLYGMPVKVRTGIAVALPGYGFKIYDRSSISLGGLFIIGGVIDASYRGEIFVNMASLNFRTTTIKAGDKIAQMEPRIPQTHFPIIRVDELPPGERGDKGYGSTGSR